MRCKRPSPSMAPTAGCYLHKCLPWLGASLLSHSPMFHHRENSNSNRSSSSSSQKRRQQYNKTVTANDKHSLMGNYVSCASSTVPANAIKVILINGGVQEFQRRIKAAELMLEHPQTFVCHGNGLQIGRRINPLLADEDLELGQLYFLLPMKKLNSVLSGTDMAALAFRANSAARAMSGGATKNAAKILPVFGDLAGRPLPQKDLEEGTMTMAEALEEPAVPRLNLDDDPELTSALTQLKLTGFRAWRPKLETITESRPKLRDLMQSNEQYC